jgi:slit protein 2
MCIEPGAFEGLNQLRILSLHGNEIAQIPEPVLAPVVGHLTHIAIGSNPLWCDCQMVRMFINTYIKQAKKCLYFKK